MLLGNEIRKEFREGRFERQRSVEEVVEEMVGKGISVLDMRREAMVGAGEGDLEKTNIRVWREGGSDNVGVEWGGDKGNGVSSSYRVPSL